MREIALTQGLVALVDDEDYERLSAHKWCVLRTAKNVYAKRTRKAILMHRVVLNAQKGVVVDHINFNGLDNRKENLRLCTNTENARHSRKHKAKTSRFKGVEFCKQTGRWRARIKNGKLSLDSGRHATEEEAALAANALMRKHFGEFAVLNEL